MLSDERLAVIRAMLTLTDVGDAQWNVITELLHEVERLQAFVREVAGDHEHHWEAVDPQEVWYCPRCREYSQDYAEDVQMKARALLWGVDGEREE